MAATAFQIQYRQEYLASFELGLSYLGASVTREAMIKGNQATFLVAGTGGASAVTRGVNGLIPARQDDLNQYTATLVEWHDLVQRTSFNIFASQGDGRRIMQDTTRKVMSRKIDYDILTELANATQDAGGAATMSLSLAVRAWTILANANVPVEEEDNMFFVVSPAAQAYLMQIKEFASSEYVDVKPFVGPTRRYRRWMGFNWILHSGLSGVGTAAELCYAFHRNAIGHAANTEDMEVAVGYEEEQAYSWARASAYMGSKILQNTGIVKVTHDGSAYVAT
jgi:Phage capsid protein